MNLQVFKKTINIGLDKPYKLFVLSDLHIGSNDFNEKGFKKEMTRAYSRCDGILIIGDIFDAIFSKDKRYKPSVPTADIAGIDAQLNGVLEKGVELLKPFADKIILISSGNHEHSILKYCNIDIISLLIYRLNRECGGEISQGGYHGFVYLTFKTTKGTIGYTIYYNHGFGGNAPVTKGMTDFARIKVNYDYDCYFQGHKHNKITDSGGMIIRVTSRGNIKATKQLSCQVGTFANNIHNTKNIGFGDMHGFGAHADGGVYLVIESELNKTNYELRTSLIV